MIRSMCSTLASTVRRTSAVTLLVFGAVLALGACAKKRTETVETQTPEVRDSLRQWPGDTAAMVEGEPFGPPPPALRDTIQLYVAKLHDRTFWTPYGEEQEPSKWWLAAERLGELGAPAIPSLMNTLADPDSFSVMLALYSLLLASQDPRVLARTNGEYVRYQGVVLDSTRNAMHKEIALGWWAKYRGLWEGTSRAVP